MKQKGKKFPLVVVGRGRLMGEWSDRPVLVAFKTGETLPRKNRKKKEKFD